MAGRVETYLHSDMLTENKGGSLISLACQTDFCAKTDEFKQFAKKVAKFAFAADGMDLKEAFPDLEVERLALEEKLGERIWIVDIKLSRISMPLCDSYDFDRKSGG